MEATAIIAAPAVTGESRLPANAPQSNGDFKAVLKQQVSETGSETGSQTGSQLGSQMGIGLVNHGSVQPETQKPLSMEVAGIGEDVNLAGVTALLKLLQETLAGAGYQQEVAGIGNAEMAGNAVNADIAGIAASADIAGIAASADIAGIAASADIAGIAASVGNVGAVGTPGAAGTIVFTGASKTSGDDGITVNTGITGKITTTGSMETAAGTWQTNAAAAGSNVTAGNILQTGQHPLISNDLMLKLSELVNKFSAGKEITGEIQELMKNYGVGPVLKAMKEILAGLAGTNIDDAKVINITVMQENGANKPAVFVIPGETVNGQQAQVSRPADNFAGLQQDKGQGNGEARNFTPFTPVTEATARFVAAQPVETVKPPVNNLARWTEDILANIGEKAKLILGSSQSEMQIQLKPDFLGKVNLQVTMENGQVTARIGVENLQVKELVEANLKQLQQNLDSQGLKVSNLVVDLTANRQFHHFNRHQDQGKAIRVNATANNEEYGSLLPEDRSTSVGWRSMDSTVDYIA